MIEELDLVTQKSFEEGNAIGKCSLTLVEDCLLVRQPKLKACILQDTAAADAPQEADDTSVLALKQASGDHQPMLLSKVSEVARFGALKEKKHSLEAGISLFNG